MSTLLYPGDPEGDATLDAIATPDAETVPRIVTGFFGGRTVAVRHREIDGAWTLVDGGDPEHPLVPHALPITGWLGAAGDVDADGVDDLVLLDEASLGIARGGTMHVPSFDCTARIPLPSAHYLLAVGDHDGDGRADIAVSDGSTILVLSRT